MSHLIHEDSECRWSTSSYGAPAGPSAAEIRSLGEHLNQCRLGSLLSALECAVQAAQGFVAAHLFTSLAIVLALLGWVLSILT